MMQRGDDEGRHRDHDDRRHRDHDDRRDDRRDHDYRREDRRDDRRDDRREDHRDYDREDHRHDRRDRDGEFYGREQADDEGDAIRVEVNAYVKDKAFEGHRMMEGGDDGHRADRPHGPPPAAGKPPAAGPGPHGPPPAAPKPPAAGPGPHGPPPPHPPHSAPAGHHPFHHDDYHHQDGRRDDRFYGREAEEADRDAVDVDVKAYVRDRDFDGRREMMRKPGHRNFDHGNHMREGGDEYEGEREMASGEETGVEVHASVHGKDFSGHRMKRVDGQGR